jgi:hypothetical protein
MIKPKPIEITTRGNFRNFKNLCRVTKNIPYGVNLEE